MRQPSTVQLWLRRLVALVAGVLIVLAVLVGIARLFLPLVPDYQNEIRRFVSATTGLNVQFARVSASWPLAGPEFRFRDVEVSTRTGSPLLAARELRVGINLWRLIMDRRLLPGRVGVTGARVQLERNRDGRFLFNGVPLEDLVRRPQDEALPRLDLEFEAIDLTLKDPNRLEPQVRLAVGQFNLRLARPLVEFSGEVDEAPGLAGALELAGSFPAAFLPGAAPGPTPEWSFKLQGSDWNLVRLFRLFTDLPGPLQAGSGDVTLEARVDGTRPVAVAADLRLSDVRLDGAQEAGPTYRQLDLRAGWEQTASGWSARLERLTIRRGQGSAISSTGRASLTRDEQNAGRLQLSADMLPLADLWPLVRAVASPDLRGRLLPESLAGSVRNLAVDATLVPGGVSDYAFSAAFQDLGVTMPAPGPAVAGLTGQVQGNQKGGELRLNGTAGLIRLPALFRADIPTTRSAGTFTWKLTPAGPDIFVEDLRIATAEGESRSRLRLLLPPAANPVVDLVMRFSVSSAPKVLDYVPLHLLRPGVATWLEQAIVAGRVPRGELIWQGPVHGFPYAAGDGSFRLDLSVEEAVLAYAPDWPRLQDLTARIVIDRTTLESVENSGSIGGIPFQDAEVRVTDLPHDAILTLDLEPQVDATQILSFLRQSPVGAAFGPALASVTAAGPVTAAIQLELPIHKPQAYRLDGTLDAGGVNLGLRGVALFLAGLQGPIRLDNARISADGLNARLLDEPVTVVLRPAGAEQPGLRAVAELRGRTPVEKAGAAFSLPFAERLSGSFGWVATAYLPERRTENPLRIQLQSDLLGLVSTLAPPLDKPADTAEPLDLEVSFPEPGRMRVAGGLRRGVSLAAAYESGPDNSWRLARGAIQLGGGQAALPAGSGLAIAGRLESLRLEDWLPGRDTGSGPGSAIRTVDLKVGSLSLFGRRFPDVGLQAARSDRLWTIDIAGPAAAGVVMVPASTGPDAPVTVELQRLWLAEGESEPGDTERQVDPRNLPPLRVSVDDLAIGDMKFGRLKAELAQRGDGVVVEPLSLTSASFTITGDAAWLVEDNDVDRQRSELRLELKSRDIRSTLEALGYRPVVEGEKAELTVDLFWPGGPGQDVLAVAGGRVRVRLEDGQVLGVEPGGGRLVGLLSIAALPRRLGMDFSDVVAQGLAFDQVQGEFRFDRGSAFTCNLGLEGPVTDLAIVGKVDFNNRSYDQLAVVRSHVSDVLALGSVVGGPVVGGTVLLLSQIFRKPLSSLGEAYYRITGGWDEPEVDRVQRSQVDLTPFRDCERYFAEMLRQLPPEIDTGR